jgi:PAS domain S-box-containing protein
LYPEADRGADKPARELVIARDQGRFEEEAWRVRKDGTTFWANVVISPLYDPRGELRAFSKVTRDLSERRDAEARYRLLVESVRDYAIITLDRRGIVQTWNAGAERIKGWSASEIIGQDFRRFYTPADIERDYPTYELDVAAKVGRYEDEGWRIRKDGMTFWANVVITALRDPTGAVIGFSKVTRDLTERRRAEEALRKAYDDLESFSYSVSHDLRAPLRSMDGFSDELMRRYADTLDDRGKDYLRRIRASAQQMARLIDDLLNLSRLGRTKLTRVSIDLAELARKIADELRRTDPDREVELVIAPAIIVHADAALMRVVLENLIGNAWKYTSHHPTARIEVGAVIAHGVQTIFVRDDGAGFDMKFGSKLFGAFQRLHAAEKFPGTGIGLATVQRIIHRHGGEVSATGALEAGATFTFTVGG